MNLNKQSVHLSDLKPGQKGIIKDLSACPDASALMEMGCIPGEAITMVARAPLGDPITVKVSGYRLSLRKQQAREIAIQEAALVS